MIIRRCYAAVLFVVALVTTIPAWSQQPERLPTFRVWEVQPLPDSQPAATPTGISLTELENMALSRHPTVARDQARIEALEGKWIQAGLPPNPTFGYMADDIGLNGAAGMHGVFAQQKFIRGGKLLLSQAVAEQEIAVAQAQLETDRVRVLTDVQRYFYRVLVAARRRDTARELLRISNAAVEASRRLLAAQEVSRVGLLQTQLTAQQTRIVVRTAENELRAAWDQLRAVTGNADLPEQPLAGNPDTMPAPCDWDESLTRLLQESPQFAAALARLEQARWQLQRAIAQVVPDMTVQASTMYDTGADDFSTGIQLGLQLPLINRNQGGIQQAHRGIAVAEENIRRLEFQLRNRLAQVFQQYATARFQVDQYKNDILPTAKETYDLVTAGYREGEVGYLDLLNAQRVYFQTNLAWLDALRDLWDATVRIEGLLLDDALEQM